MMNVQSKRNAKDTVFRDIFRRPGNLSAGRTMTGAIKAGRQISGTDEA